MSAPAISDERIPADAWSDAAPFNAAPAIVQRPQTPCFTSGTLITTRRGAVAVEDLRLGDWVLTRDSGYRPIRWIGARLFDQAALAIYPELGPVQIAAGALGGALPERDLLVSPQHCMLLAGSVAQDLLGEAEILVSAEDLIALGMATTASVATVTYFHILFDDHEIVLANGAWSESFNPEKAALEGLHQLQRNEIYAIFPELAARKDSTVYPLARKTYRQDPERIAA